MSTLWGLFAEAGHKAKNVHFGNSALFTEINEDTPIAVVFLLAYSQTYRSRTRSMLSLIWSREGAATKNSRHLVQRIRRCDVLDGSAFISVVGPTTTCQGHVVGVHTIYSKPTYSPQIGCFHSGSEAEGWLKPMIARISERLSSCSYEIDSSKSSPGNPNVAGLLPNMPSWTKPFRSVDSSDDHFLFLASRCT